MRFCKKKKTLHVFGLIRQNCLKCEGCRSFALLALKTNKTVPVRTTYCELVVHISWYCELNTSNRTTTASEEGPSRTFSNCHVHNARSDDCRSRSGKRAVQQAASSSGICGQNPAYQLIFASESYTLLHSNSSGFDTAHTGSLSSISVLCAVQ